MRTNSPGFPMLRVTLSTVTAALLYHWLAATSWPRAIIFAVIWGLSAALLVFTLMRPSGQHNNPPQPHRFEGNRTQ